MSRGSAAPRTRRGQALTEFLGVTAFLLMPLFLLVPLVASLISHRQDVESAARYAAWERTAWHADGSGPADAYKSDARVAREIDARVLAAEDQPLTSHTSDALRSDPFLQRAQTGENWLRTDEAVGVPGWTTQRSVDAEPEGLAGLSNDAVGAMGAVTRFDLPRGGRIDAQVSTRWIDVRGVFALPEAALERLVLTRRSRLFVEGWTGGEPERVAYQVSGLLPQQFLDNGVVRRVQDVAAFAPGARELDADWLRFGHVDLEPLPAYRLGPQAPGR